MGDVENDKFWRAISEECEALSKMLIDKNQRYGNSVLNPIGIFASSDPTEQINVRIDDKLSRIKSSQGNDNEDAEMDLIGYLILKRAIKRAFPALSYSSGPTTISFPGGTGYTYTLNPNGAKNDNTHRE